MMRAGATLVPSSLRRCALLFLLLLASRRRGVVASSAAFVAPRTGPPPPSRFADGARGRRRRARGLRAPSTPAATTAAGDVEPAAASAAAAEDYSKMTVAELKDRLRERKFPVGGRKAELIARLEEHRSSRASALASASDSDSHSDSDLEYAVGNVKVQPEELQSKRDKLQTDEDLSRLTVPVLKDRLRDLGLPVGGRKAELIERIRGASKEDDAREDAPAPKEPVVARASYANWLPMAAEEEAARESAGDTVEDIWDAMLDDEEEEDDADEAKEVARGSEGDGLLDILDEILSDVEEEDGYEETLPESGDGLPPLELAGNSMESSTAAENPSVRRAGRKKYWKTQEVREAIRSNDPKAAAKAEDMIATLERMADEEGDENYLLGPIQFTLLIDAYAKGGTHDDVRRAEAVIDRLLEANGRSNGTTAAPPTAQMLNALIGAYANLGDPEGAAKAGSLLDRMEYLEEFGDGSVAPTVHSYSIVAAAWAKCGIEDGAARAEDVLTRLFDAYQKELDAGEGDRSRRADELRPNNIVFNSAIDAWARSGSPDAGEKAEALLHRMEALSHMDDYDVRPDTISFNTCIKAWCNSGRADAPFKAESILSKLETNPQYPKRNGGVLTIRPNRLSYNTCINAWAKSNTPESAMHAEDLLLRMIKSYKSDAFSTLTPDAVTFASVLNALAKSKSVRFKAEKCSSILTAMADLHEEDGSYDTKPNIICYNTVLNACAFSAHSSPQERRNALAVAVQTFNDMRAGDYVVPDAVSYGNMLKCCANLMPPGDQRNGMASRLFASCCDEGLVGGMALDEIRRCIPPRAFLPLLADCGYDKPVRQRRKAHSIQLREFPRKWTANVKRGDMASRQRESFAKPKGKRKRRDPDKEEKEPPVIRRPGLLVEYGASAKDL